jgi:CRISPR/Cas system CSM-associated protein Csm3 (group 7 of RAMP superfamily)
MFDLRYEIEGDLRLLTPLHHGVGEPRLVDGIDGDNGAPVLVSAILRDWQSRPMLQRASLKGWLRAVAEEMFDDGELTQDDITGLFGPGKRAAGRGMGRVIVHGGECRSLGDATHLPFTASTSGVLGSGVYIAARTAIEPRSGTAAGHRLFRMEMVAPDAIFRLRLILLGQGQPDLDAERLARLIKLLHRLTVAGGVPFGSGRSEGSGALQLLESSVVVTRRSIGPDGVLSSLNITSTQWEERSKPSILERGDEIRLVCNVPFLVADVSRSAKETRPAQKSDEATRSAGPQIVAQRCSETEPLLPATSLAGALRARARWLHALIVRRNGGVPDTVDRAAYSSDGRQPTFGDPGFKTAADLTSVERLFGIAGFRALLDIKKLSISQGREILLTSVKIDNFSGAPFDQALFTTRAFVGVSINFYLVLRDRGNSITTADRDLANELIRDLREHGIMLGAGSSKGFGWFEPTRE